MRPEEVINKMKETRDQSETGHSKRTEFGHGPGHEEVVLPIVGPSKRKIGVEPLDPPPVKQPSDSPGPVRRLSASEVDLIGLVGSTEVPALLIPAGRQLSPCNKDRVRSGQTLEVRRRGI